MAKKSAAKPLVFAVVLAAVAVGGFYFYQNRAADPVPAFPAAATPGETPPAQPAAVTGDDYAVIRYAGGQIPLSEVQKDINTMLPGMEASFDTMPPVMQENLAKNIVSRRILIGEAQAAGIQNDPEVQSRLKLVEQQILLDAYIRRQARASLSDDKLRALYEERVRESSGKEEIRARHILVETREQADDVVRKLKGGADFAQLAQERSKDQGSGASGGDLGYFTREQMVKEFADAAFNLQPGQVSDPVKTEFGWHVIKIEDRRPMAAPDFETMKPQLQSELEATVLTDYMNSVIDRAQIQVLDKTGAVRMDVKGNPSATTPPATAPAGEGADVVPPTEGAVPDAATPAEGAQPGAAQPNAAQPNAAQPDAAAPAGDGGAQPGEQTQPAPAAQ